MSRQKIIAANWKMNGDLALIEAMSNALIKLPLNHAKAIICPSFPFLALLSEKVSHSKVAVGAQNMSHQESGAYTGEVSGNMLTALSVSYVILGHSERRSLYHESSQLIAEKVKLALDKGLKPILCIGESEQERVSGETETVLVDQIKPVIDMIGIEKFDNVVIAYEPVWAIGTGKTASPAMAQETHAFIRGFIAQQNNHIAQQLSLLYGGSMNAANAEDLLTQPDIDGGLIGGASLKVDEFSMICSIAEGI